MILYGHNEKRKWPFAFFFTNFLRHARPLTHPPSSDSRKSLFSTERAVCHSLLFRAKLSCGKLWRYEAPSIFFLFSFPSFQHSLSTHTAVDGIRGPTNQSFTFHTNRRYPLLPRPRPLTNLHKHLNTPHSPLNFNLTILISAPGASNFTSSLWYQRRTTTVLLNQIFFFGVERIFWSSKQQQKTPHLSPLFPSSMVIGKDDFWFSFLFFSFWVLPVGGADRDGMILLLSVFIEMIHTRQQYGGRRRISVPHLGISMNYIFSSRSR